MTMEIGKWSELPMGSSSDHVLIDQLWPQSNKNIVSDFTDGRVTFYWWSFVCFLEFRLLGGNNVTVQVNQFVT